MKTQYAEKCTDPLLPKNPECTHVPGKPSEKTWDTEMAEITSIQKAIPKPLFEGETTGLVNQNYKLWNCWT